MGLKHSSQTKGTKLNVQQMTDAQISEQLSKQKEQLEDEKKILFFGLPGCGGSLIMYKIREYTASQKNQHRSTEVSPNAVFKEIIQYNTLRCVQQIIHASTRLDLPLWSLQDKVDVDLIEQIVNEIRTTHFCFNQGSINPELGKKLKIIWSLSGAKVIFEHRDDSKLSYLTDMKHTPHLLKDVDRICALDYLPTDNDVKYYHDNYNQDCRGVEEIAFEFSGQKFRIFNVESQIGEKRKWIHHFDTVDIVCFLCPLGEYDQPPILEGRSNIVAESYILFQEMCSVRAFRTTPIVALLTKHDVFLEKVLETDLICCFEDYNGGCVEAEAIKFVTNKFLTLKQDPVSLAKKRRLSEAKILMTPRSHKLSMYDPSVSAGMSSNLTSNSSLLASMGNTKPDEGDVYINFVSQHFTLQEIINNLGGTLKNIQFMKHLDKSEQLLLQIQSQPKTPRNK